MSTVTYYLQEHGVRFETLPHQRAYTAIDEAISVGVSPAEVVKTVVLDTPQGHALAVIPGSRRLNMRAIRQVVKNKHVRLATEDEVVRDFPGYEPGALPPLGSLLHVPAYVDTEVARRDTIVFATGRQTESVRVHTVDLLHAEHPTLASLTQTERREERPL